MNALGPLAKGLAFLMGKQPEEERHPRGFLGLEWAEDAGSRPGKRPSSASPGSSSGSPPPGPTSGRAIAWSASAAGRSTA